MMVEIGHPGVQAQEFLSTFPSSESLLTSLLSPCGSMFLLNQVVTAGLGDHRLMVNVNQAWNLLNRRSVTLELIGTNDLWDIVFSQQPGQEGLRRFGVPMPLEENVEHEPVLVYGPPKPVSNTINCCTDLVQVPPGTPTGFPVTKMFSEEGPKLDAPLAEGLMADLNATLVQQFLNISVADREAVVQPHSVLDDGHWETVAVGLRVGHGGSAYPTPIKATQPPDVHHRYLGNTRQYLRAGAQAAAEGGIYVARPEGADHNPILKKRQSSLSMNTAGFKDLAYWLSELAWAGTKMPDLRFRNGMFVMRTSKAGTMPSAV